MNTRLRLPQLQHALSRMALGRLLLFALVVRVLFCIYYITGYNSWELVPAAGETRAVAGVDGYIQLATTLMATGQYAYEPDGPAVHNRPPLHPALMALTAGWWPTYWYFPWMATAIALQLLTLWLLAGVARGLGGGAAAVNALVLVLALHPQMLLAVRSSTFVTPGLLVLLAVAAAVLKFRQTAHLKWAALAGLASGAAALTHGTLLAIPLVAAAFVAWPERRWRAAGVVLAVAVAVVLPWTVRNYQVFQQVIPVATGAGSQYWKGEAFYVSQPDLEARVFEAVSGRPLDMVYFGTVDPADDKLFLDTAIAHMKAHPVHYALRTAWSLGMFWLPYDGGPLKALLAGVCNLPPLLLIAWAWLRALKRRRWPAFAVVLCSALLLAVQVPFALLAGQTSYFMLLTPILWLAAWGGIKEVRSEK